ncbi:uncharacterized protein RAG0_11972 [Rhynchosporium agropyri]|uniref:Uncharacterized protein n=1 Tax=Rhynchosporium agropyri TaxID=914238 RepID=A0A1E1L6M1_9HELO|nr:uncharacterized protein RAG0_11972 [Rhynchosporium agropyri]
MCHQLIHMFKCAHQREPTIVRCKAPDSDCETPFLEPRMKSVKRSDVLKQQQRDELRKPRLNEPLELPRLLTKDTGLESYEGSY